MVMHGRRGESSGVNGTWKSCGLTSIIACPVPTETEGSKSIAGIQLLRGFTRQANEVEAIVLISTWATRA